MKHWLTGAFQVLFRSFAALGLLVPLLCLPAAKVPTDLNGDGISDLPWTNADGSVALWLMNGSNPVLGAGTFGPYPGWSLFSTDADFNGDGMADVVWVNTNGAVSVWLMNGLTPISQTTFGPYAGWSLVSANNDFNGDGKNDLLWQNSNGQVAIWLMNGASVLSTATFGPYAGWSVVSGNSDFNGDHNSDLLWQNSNGQAAVWLMNGTSLVSSSTFGPYAGWTVLAGDADYNGDGNTDLLWQNSTGAISTWLMSGTSVLATASFGPYSGWSVLPGRHDFNGDGMSDLLWTNNNGAASVWLMIGLAPVLPTTFGPYAGWSVLGSLGDYNGDGKSDLLWSNINGQAAVWLMNGLAGESIQTLGPFSGWQVAAGSTAGGGFHTLGGTITGMTASGLVLSAAGQTLTIPANATSFTFPVPLTTGVGYVVKVATQPSGLNCAVSNGTGTVGLGNIVNLAVTCSSAGAASGNQTIVGGNYHSCGVTSGGGVLCWGGYFYGELGNGSFSSSVVPVPVTGLSSGVIALAAGADHTCALTNGGAVWCWGWNAHGQLGDGTTNDSAVPVAVSGLSSGVVALSAAAGGQHTCAVTNAGAAMCWGYNVVGQLGNGSNVDSAVPVTVSGLSSGVATIASGATHNCALTTAGAVQCWGDNFSGELGNNSTNASQVPVPVSGLSSGVASIAAGVAISCAVTSGGGAQCWGDNRSGELGVSNFSGFISEVPLAVSGLSSGVTAMTAGNRFTCAVTQGGAAQCWGYNTDGEVGNNSNLEADLPAQVYGLTSGVVAIGAGYDHACALTSAGHAQCWGRNLTGDLGNNSTNNSNVPVPVSGF